MREVGAPHRARVARAQGHPVTPRSVPYTRHQPGGSPLQRLVKAGSLGLEQRREAGGHRHRIAGERTRLIHGSLGRDESHQLRAPAVRADRHPAPDDLAERREIGPHAQPRLRAARRDAEPRHHLVEDQERPGRVAQGAQRRVKAGLGGDEPGVADVGLHDDGGDLRPAPPKHVLHRRRVVEGHGHRELGQRPRHARAVGQAERGDAAPRSHEEAVRVAVITALELEHEISPRRRPGDAYRRHRRFGARAHESHHLDRGHPPAHHLGEPHLAFAGRPVGPPPLRGAPHGLQHRGVRVPEDERTPRAHVVHVALPVRVREAAAGGPGHEKGRPAYRPERPNRGADAAGHQLLGPVEQLARPAHVSATARKS